MKRCKIGWAVYITYREEGRIKARQENMNDLIEQFPRLKRSLLCTLRRKEPRLEVN